MTKARIDIPTERVAEFCRANHIPRLTLFGSAPRDDFGPDSDVDVLVEFEPGAHVGLLRLAGIEIEMGELLGRKVDLNTSPAFCPTTSETKSWPTRRSTMTRHDDLSLLIAELERILD
ncbi:MAG: nucleotidyltransferase domain-containing protein [Phycisphaerales bacterium]|nr:MAG: nucleotidyltransferase domain-containing protein [Phycisphaerales bacterium]